MIPRQLQDHSRIRGLPDYKRYRIGCEVAPEDCDRFDLLPSKRAGSSMLDKHPDRAVDVLRRKERVKAPTQYVSLSFEHLDTRDDSYHTNVPPDKSRGCPR